MDKCKYSLPCSPDAPCIYCERDTLKQRLAKAEVNSFNEGLETAAQIFDRKEVFHYQVATWDRTMIVKGSKYNVPTNGPAIACAGAEKQAKEIRALKRTPPTPTDKVLVRRYAIKLAVSVLLSKIDRKHLGCTTWFEELEKYALDQGQEIPAPEGQP